MLASCGGYGQALSRAGLLALADGDPREARPQPPGPEWDDRVREIVQIMLDEKIAADVRIAFAADTVALRVGFESSGQIASVEILPPQHGQGYPWAGTPARSG